MQITLRNAKDPLGDMIEQLRAEVSRLQNYIHPYQQTLDYNQEIIDRLTSASAETKTNHFAAILHRLRAENTELLEQIEGYRQQLVPKQAQLNHLLEAAALTQKRPTCPSGQ